MTLAKHGVTAKTPDSILFGAGTIYKNLKVSADDISGTIVGATSGGNKLSLASKFKQIDVDGVTVPIKELEFVEEQEAKMDVNLIESGKDILEMALLTKPGTSDNAKFDLLELRSVIEESDYLENIAWVGFTTSNTPMIIILENAICTSGIEIDSKDQDGTVIPLTFEARGDAATSIDTLPVKIYLANDTYGASVANRLKLENEGEV